MATHRRPIDLCPKCGGSNAMSGSFILGCVDCYRSSLKDLNYPPCEVCGDLSEYACKDHYRCGEHVWKRTRFITMNCPRQFAVCPRNHQSRYEYDWTGVHLATTNPLHQRSGRYDTAVFFNGSLADGNLRITRCCTGVDGWIEHYATDGEYMDDEYLTLVRINGNVSVVCTPFEILCIQAEHQRSGVC